jgi:heparosan-N-sulfate-glucuronate 5-epimerase
MSVRTLDTLVRYLHPRGAVSFWHTPVGPVRYDYSGLGDYYIDLTAKTDYRGPFDADGVPMLDYFGSIGRQYNPCAVAQWGLGAWQRWRRGDAAFEAVFRRAAQWLRSRLEVDARGRGYWWYGFDIHAYGLRAPWPSALAQAQGLQVLLRAHRIWGDHSDLAAARQACSAMIAPVEDGGMLLGFDGFVVLEEAVADRPTAILDGLMFAAFGLQDYCYAVPDDVETMKLMQRVYDSIARLLPRFDLGYWSRADLYSVDVPMPASHFYHGLHVAQLRVLADLTGLPTFGDYASRWEEAAASPWNRSRAFAAKLAFKFRHY